MSNPRNIEEGLGDHLNDALTNGWYSASKGLSKVIMKVFASNALSLMHHRFGTYFLTWGTLRWNMAIMFFFWLAANGVGKTILSFQILIVAAAFVYHIFESKNNLQKASKGNRRHSLYIGDSFLWGWYVRLVHATGMQDSFFGKVTGNGFVKYGQTLLFVLLGFVFIALGLPANGFLFIMGGASVFALFRDIEKEELKIKQQVWDAQGESEEIQEAQSPNVQSRPNRVTRPPLVRRS